MQRVQLGACLSKTLFDDFQCSSATSDPVGCKCELCGSDFNILIEPSTSVLIVLVLLQSQLPQIMSGRLWWGFATGLLGIAAVSVPGAAVNGSEKLEPGVP